MLHPEVAISGIDDDHDAVRQVHHLIPPILAHLPEQKQPESHSDHHGDPPDGHPSPPLFRIIPHRVTDGPPASNPPVIDCGPHACVSHHVVSSLCVPLASFGIHLITPQLPPRMPLSRLKCLLSCARPFVAVKIMIDFLGFEHETCSC
jgi:hypothetical protein